MFAVAVTMFAVVWSAVPAAGAGQAGLRTQGFVLLGGDGGIFPYSVPMAGAAASDPTRCPDNVTDRTEPNGACWSVALTPSGFGYWILNGDTGKIYAYGTAGFYGEPATRFAGVGREFIPNFLQIVPTPDAKGYWVYESGPSGLGTVDHFANATDPLKPRYAAMLMKLTGTTSSRASAAQGSVAKQVVKVTVPVPWQGSCSDVGIDAGVL